MHIACLIGKVTGGAVQHAYAKLKLLNMTGLQSWQQSGKEEHAKGEAEYNAAQAKGYAEGTMDRVGGKKDAVVGALTGDRQQEAQGMSI